MRRPDPETLDALAGEYVLGTLAGPARARFERWIETDPAVRSMVENWERRLGRLADDVPEKAPSPALWDAIADELGHKTRRNRQPAKISRRSFWFSLGSAAATASVMGGVVGILAWPQRSYAFPTHYAMLRDDNDKLAWIVAIHQDHGLYQVHDVPGTPAAPHGKEDHLFMLAGGQQHLHFGAVEDDARKTLPSPAHKRIDGATFLVSHEDRGAHGLARPTVKPIYSGIAVDARANPPRPIR